MDCASLPWGLSAEKRQPSGAEQPEQAGRELPLPRLHAQVRELKDALARAEQAAAAATAAANRAGAAVAVAAQPQVPQPSEAERRAQDKRAAADARAAFLKNKPWLA